MPDEKKELIRPTLGRIVLVQYTVLDQRYECPAIVTDVSDWERFEVRLFPKADHVGKVPEYARVQFQEPDYGLKNPPLPEWRWPPRG